MSEAQSPELRAAYRTLNEPTRLLGFSFSAWAWLLAAGGAARRRTARPGGSRRGTAVGCGAHSVARRRRRAMSRARSIADALSLAAVEPDGLIVTSDGAYVRLLSCRQPLQPLRGGCEHRDGIREQLAAIAGRIPAGQRLQVLVEAEPIQADRELATDWSEIGAAAAAIERQAHPARAAAMRRLGYGLEQTIRRSASAVQAARITWTVATRWQVQGAPIPRRSRRARTLSRTTHERAAAESFRFSDAVARELTGAGCQTRELDGPEAIAAFARLVQPDRSAAAEQFADLPRVLDTTDVDEALAHRHALLEAVAGDAELKVARDWIEHRASSEVEASMHLAGAPADTSVWWLMGLMEVPPPWRLSVHVTATDRARQRRAQRLRHKRLWADLRRRERDGKLIGQEVYEQEREAAELDAELRLTGASGIYDVAIYLALRRPAHERDELADQLTALSRDFESYTDARLYTGRFLAEDSWIATLPLGDERLGATRRFAHRNIGDCLPLLTTSASSQEGVPLGYAVPGQTLERVDLFDPGYRTHVALVTGSSGSGKTVAVNALLARNLARGATGFIIDRSSSEDEGGSTRFAGHYEQLAALIPGARTVHFGAGRHEHVLCPWDVVDPARVPTSKTEFLVALHTLLIGDHGPGGDRTLGGLERTLLARGIAAVYDRCARSGERPRELLLYEELRRLAREQAVDATDGDQTIASEYRRLAERLHPYIEGGSSAWLTDDATTVQPDAPLLLFDLAGLPDALAGPVMLTLVDFIDRQVQRRRAHHVAHPESAAGPWAGRAFVAIDEAWKPLLTPAAGAWLNEWARRTRHLACALLVITQHLADFANAQGEALLRNSVLRLIFRTSYDELDDVKHALGLQVEDLDTIARLDTRKGEYSTCLLDSEAHGRTRVRLLLGDIEYWMCSADPHRDQPVRRLALADAGGDAWSALRLLVDPTWHEAQIVQLTSESVT